VNRFPKISDHGSEIALLGVIAIGVMAIMGVAHWHTGERPFDPSAYLVVLTLIVGAIKERWTQRSVDRMGEQLGGSSPATDAPTGNAGDPVHVTDDPRTGGVSDYGRTGK